MVSDKLGVDRVATSELVTIEKMKEWFPSRKNTITDELVELINSTANDAEFQGESLLSTALTYEELMKKHRASLIEYVDAIKFCAYMLTMDDNATEAYKRTFSRRKFVQERWNVGTDDPKYRELTNAASVYKNKNKLVQDLLLYSQTPSDIMYMGLRNQAVLVLAQEMANPRNSGMVKVAAAKELLAATKGVEKLKVDIDLSGSQQALSMADQLNSQLAIMVNQQAALLNMGANIKDVQKIGVNLNVIDVDVDDE